MAEFPDPREPKRDPVQRDANPKTPDRQAETDAPSKTPVFKDWAAI